MAAAQATRSPAAGGGLSPAHARTLRFAHAEGKAALAATAFSLMGMIITSPEWRADEYRHAAPD